MKWLLRDVLQFIRQVDLPANEPWPLEESKTLICIGRQLLLAAELLEGKIQPQASLEASKRLKFTRAHLLCEELGELLVAMGRGDEEGSLDGAIDLIYVAVGLGITYDWPMVDAWEVIQASNMSKTRKTDDARCRDKGSGYVAPDIASILKINKNKRELPND